MSSQIPIVEYLVLGDKAHLVAWKCATCDAHYFDRRDACACCFGTEFSRTDVPTEGTLETFTIVTVAAPGVSVPFVAAVVDCGGIAVRSNIVNVEPTPEALKLGMPLQLTTFAIGTDDNGQQAVNFAYEPATTTRDV